MLLLLRTSALTAKQNIVVWHTMSSQTQNGDAKSYGVDQSEELITRGSVIRPPHITRSSIHFNILGYPGKVTFNDPLSTFFTLTFHGPVEDAPEVCPLIRENILTGIEVVSRNLNYLPRSEASSSSPVQNKVPTITFLCPCDITPLHPAAMSRNGKYLLHPDNAQTHTSVTDEHKMWLMRKPTPEAVIQAPPQLGKLQAVL